MPNPRPTSQNPWFAMSALPRAIGVVLLVVGSVWTLQGIGVAKGSVMTGRPFWAVLGLVFVVAGVVVLRRALAAAKAAVAPADDAGPGDAGLGGGDSDDLGPDDPR